MFASRLSLKPVVAAQARSVAARAARPTWYPGAVPPKNLDGSMPGDYGFDPLRLSGNAEALPWYREAERQNGRWAMAACAGILFTDAVGLGNWWEAGAQEYALDFKTLAIIEVITMIVFEAANYKSLSEGKETGVLGSKFDPLNMESDATRLKEIKNGRLAMVSFVGYCSQAAVQGKGPIECFKDHLADPYHNNIFTSKVGLEATVAVVALSIAPMIINAVKSLGNDEDEFRPLPF